MEKPSESRSTNFTGCINSILNHGETFRKSTNFTNCVNSYASLGNSKLRQVNSFPEHKERQFCNSEEDCLIKNIQKEYMEQTDQDMMIDNEIEVDLTLAIGKCIEIEVKIF